jgi:NUMOD4 motif-containing protein
MEQLTFDLSANDSAPAKKGRGVRRRIDDQGRECGDCGQYKPWDDFHISRTTRYGHITTCKPCMTVKGAEKTRERQAARPPKVTPLCSITGCGKDAHCRGWCKGHYESWRLYGSPLGQMGEPPERPGLPGENWRPIPTYEGLYDASDHGRVWSVPRHAGDGRFVGGKILKGDLSDPRGYVRYGLKRPGESRPTHHLAHRLVLWAFTGENPAELDTRHLDGNPANNRWAPGSTDEEMIANGGNLVYGTRSENAYDRVRHGTWVNNNKYTDATHCINGHAFDEANTYWRPTGGRACKACPKERAAARRAAAKREAA